MNFPKAILQKLPGLLCFLMILVLFTAPAYAEDAPEYSDSLWSNGSYTTTIGGMAARELYVYGLIENTGELTENHSDRDLSFSENEPISRLAAAKLLYQICGGTPSGQCPFTDVPEPYQEAIAWLYEHGVVRGIGNDLYGTGNITEHHFLIMLSRTLGWNTEDANQLYERASQEGILPICHSGAGFSAGDLYQMAVRFLEKYYPEKCCTVNPPVGRPKELQITARSCADAVRQIDEAVMFLPHRIAVTFTEQCPQTDKEDFCRLYTWPSNEQSFPLICQINLKYITPLTMAAASEDTFRIAVISYAQGHIAYVSSSNWFRVYKDTEYAKALQRFLTEQADPKLSSCTTDFDRAIAAHDLICDIVAYDYVTYDAIMAQANTENPRSHCIVGLITDQCLVCDGYANAYQWLLRYCGIESYVVIGEGNGESHAWNKVKIDGDWFNADVCWNDTGSTMSYFLKSDQNFIECGHCFTDSYSATVYASRQDHEKAK